MFFVSLRLNPDSRILCRSVWAKWLILLPLWLQKCLLIKPTMMFYRRHFRSNLLYNIWLQRIECIIVFRHIYYACRTMCKKEFGSNHLFSKACINVLWFMPADPVFFHWIVELLMKHWCYHSLRSFLHKLMFGRPSLDHWPSGGITRATYQASNAQFSNPLETHKCIYLGIGKWLINIAIVNPISQSPNICLAA